MKEDNTLHSAIYVGHVEHDRFSPKRHKFRYSIHHLYLDLDEIEEIFAQHWFWSNERRNVVSFRRSDYFGDPEVPLKTAVLDRVESELGHRPDGPVRLLTHPRYFGYVFNPVSFYFCFDSSGENLEAVLSEITNTPWNERHAYVTDQRNETKTSSLVHNRFEKEFHVSPYFTMDHTYDWGFKAPDENLEIWMQNFLSGRKVFDVRLEGKRLPWTGRNLVKVLLRNPCVTLAGLIAIYWQAARLRLKGIPHVPHPNYLAEQERLREKASNK